MLKLVTIIAFIVCSSSVACAADDREKSECEKIEQKIHKIQSKMREGYTAAQGERLNEKLRELRARRSKVCR